MNKQAIASVLLLTFGLAVVLLVWMSRARTPYSRGVRPLTSEPRSQLIVQVPSYAIRDGVALERQPAGETSPGAELRRFRVIDRQLKVPLEFTVVCAIPNVTSVMRGAGELDISATEGAWQEGIDVRLDSPGYATETTKLTGDSETTIRLEPNWESQLRITCQGAAVSVAHAAFSYWADAMSSPVAVSVDAKLGVNVRFCHTKALTVSLYDSNERLLFSEIVEPKTQRVIEWSDGQYEVMLIDEAGRPLAQVPVLFVLNTAARDRLAISDQYGCFSVPSTAGGNPGIRLATDRYRFAAPKQQMVPVTIEGGLLEFSGATNEPIDGRQWSVVLIDAVNRIRLLDAETGEPARGRAFYFERHYFGRPQRSTDMLILAQTLIDGYLEVPFGSADGGRVSEPERGPHPEGILAVQGFAPAALPPNIYVFSSSLPTGLTIDLQRPVHCADLEILDGGHPTDFGDIVVYSQATGELLFAGNASPAAGYGSFDEPDGDINVSTIQKSVTPRGPLYRLRPLGTAAPAELRSSTYEVEIGRQLGALRVVAGARPLPPLQCMSLSGFSARQSFNDQTQCLFHRLLPGRYLIGPEPWLTQARHCSEKEKLAVEVRAQETTVVEAAPEWCLLDDLEGRLIIMPEAPPLRLLAAYVLPIPPAIITSSMPELTVDGGGRYVVGRGDVWPTAIVAVDVFSGITRPRAVFEPGGSYVLEENLIRFVPNSTGQVTVLDISYVYGEEWTQLPVPPGLRSVTFRVRVTRDPVAIAFHRSVDRITLRRFGDGATQVLGPAEIDIGIVDLDRLFTAEQD
jgi:hypothetical protein